LVFADWSTFEVSWSFVALLQHEGARKEKKKEKEKEKKEKEKKRETKKVQTSAKNREEKYKFFQNKSSLLHNLAIGSKRQLNPRLVHQHSLLGICRGDQN